MRRHVLIALAAVCVPGLARSAVLVKHFGIRLGGAHAVVDGRVSPSIDVIVTMPRLRIGEIEARDIVITVRDIGHGIRACANARVGQAAVHACGTLTPSYSEVRDVTWRARAPRWSAHGEGTVTRTGQITAHAVFEGSELVEVDASGSVSDLHARGELQTDGIHLPFTAQANLREGQLTSLVASVLGGEISLDPVKVRLREPLDVVVHARGLALDRLLPSRLEGSGVVDGDVTLRVSADGAQLVSGVLHARAPGRIRVTDTRWVPKESGVQRRIAETLADFEYTQLGATVAPAGKDPDVRLAIQGHGKSVDQQLDLVINLHGARDAAQRILSRVRRST